MLPSEGQYGDQRENELPILPRAGANFRLGLRQRIPVPTVATWPVTSGRQSRSRFSSPIRSAARAFPKAKLAFPRCDSIEWSHGATLKNVIANAARTPISMVDAEGRGEPMTETTNKRPVRITRTDYVLGAVAAVTWLLCTFGTLLT